jgi:hypothetical protein
MKLKINYLKFQRNGVAGEPFYHCFCTVTDDKKREMILTFTTQNNDDKTVNWSSCRAVCINEPGEAWRGDVLAYELQRELSKEMAKHGGEIYDCCTKQDLYTV